MDMLNVKLVSVNGDDVGYYIKESESMFISIFGYLQYCTILIYFRFN